MKGGKTRLQGKLCHFSDPILVACSHREEKLDSLYLTLVGKSTKFYDFMVDFVLTSYTLDLSVCLASILSIYIYQSSITLNACYFVNRVQTVIVY